MKFLKVHKGHVMLAESLREVNEYFDALSTDSLLVFDWETTGLEHDSTPLGISFNYNGEDSIFIPFDYYFSKGISAKELIKLLNKQLRRFKLLGHNAKFDSMINYVQGILDENVRIVADTLVMVHLYDPSLEKKLETRVAKDFGYVKPDFKKLTGKKWADINWAIEGDSLLETLAGYGGEDTYWTWRVYKKYFPLLDAEAWSIHDKIEIPMINVLRDMKIRGVLIDTEYLREMAKDLSARLVEATENIYRSAGCVFNLNSPKQKQEVFFDKLKLPIIKYTKTDAPSTDSESMEAWDEMGYEIGQYLCQYSEMQKLYTGYVLAIPDMVDDRNVLRGDLNSCGTETGRMSSSNPNLQNQPNNHDFPVRKAFIPRPGYVFLNHDYSQLELRVMAHMSRDKHFLEVFRNGEDPHGDVAKRLGITRKGAKVVNFGVLYGMGPQKLAKTLDISEELAKKIINVDYMETYDGFARWKVQTENFVKKNGYVRNLFGRMRRLPEAAKDPFHVDKKKYFAALRQSVNTIIQGTGADIVKLAMLQVAKRFKEENLDAYLLLQVHDELLVEASQGCMIRAEQIVIECMENAAKLAVPLLVDGKIINNWSEMKDDDLPSVSQRFDYSLVSTLLIA